MNEQEIKIQEKKAASSGDETTKNEACFAALLELATN